MKNLSNHQQKRALVNPTSLLLLIRITLDISRSGYLGYVHYISGFFQSLNRDLDEENLQLLQSLA